MQRRPKKESLLPTKTPVRTDAVRALCCSGTVGKIRGRNVSAGVSRQQQDKALSYRLPQVCSTRRRAWVLTEQKPQYQQPKRKSCELFLRVGLDISVWYMYS